MAFLLVLACTAAACFLLRTQIKKFPAVFYLLAVALDALFVAGCLGLLPWFVWDGLSLLVRRCALAFSLFTVVMFMGVLPVGSKARSWLMPVRGELSIVACILALGHAAFYLVSYAPRLLAGGAAGANMRASFVAAVLLLVLLLVLGVTSFNVVKNRMRSTTWKRVQRFAYLFFALAYVHLALSLAPSALQGGASAQASMVAYTAVFALYAVLRATRYVLVDRSAKKDAAINQISGA